MSPNLIISATCKKETLFCFKLIESKCCFRFITEISDLFQDMFPDICNNKSLFKGKAAYILTYGLGHYFKKKMIKIPHKQEIFVMQFDELINNVVQKVQMDIHLKHINENILVHNNTTD